MSIWRDAASVEQAALSSLYVPFVVSCEVLVLQPVLIGHVNAGRVGLHHFLKHGTFASQDVVLVTELENEAVRDINLIRVSDRAGIWHRSQATPAQTRSETLRQSSPTTTKRKSATRLFPFDDAFASFPQMAGSRKRRCAVACVLWASLAACFVARPRSVTVRSLPPPVAGGEANSFWAAVGKVASSNKMDAEGYVAKIAGQAEAHIDSDKVVDRP